MAPSEIDSWYNSLREWREIELKASKKGSTVVEATKPKPSTG